ncbi:MAG: LD-carboxypeptidase [Candidatus Magasanikbacteria bacterium]|nr:LD-carboxypeptidase [Candidatus Magasanikbacteria bacterium]
MKKVFPPKLKKGDKVAVVAPSVSLSYFSKSRVARSVKILESLGLSLEWGQHAREMDSGDSSSSIDYRIADLHAAFLDPQIKGIIAVDGGYNCNQLLEYIDWDIIVENPKMFCGYSDITALQNAFFAKTGLVSYSGPCFITWSSAVYKEEVLLRYTLDHFRSAVFAKSGNDLVLESSQLWRDDCSSGLRPHKDWWIINEGRAGGTIIGGNLSTVGLLQGTPFFPSLKNSIVFLEDDYESHADIFDRDLESLFQVKESKYVRGLVIGRFEKASKMTKERLVRIIRSKKQLEQIPVIANVDFGHTVPLFTFPIGGEASFTARGAFLKSINISV